MYLDRPLCPIGSYIRIHQAYHVADRSGTSQTPTVQQCVSVITDLSPYRSKCDGNTACDGLLYSGRSLYCNNKKIPADRLLLLYTCRRDHLERRHTTICPADKAQNISCPGDGITVHLREALLVFGTQRPCHGGDLLTSDCVRHYSALQNDSFYGLQKTCGVHDTCSPEVNLTTPAICGNTTYDSADFAVITFNCRSDLMTSRFCNGMNITVSCSEGNVIHIESLYHGYLWVNSTACIRLLGEYTGQYGRYQCELDMKKHNAQYHNAIVQACEGKATCDDTLLAISGPKIAASCDNLNGTFKRDPNAEPDYVVVNYYCYSAAATDLHVDPTIVYEEMDYLAIYLVAVVIITAGVVFGVYRQRSAHRQTKNRTPRGSEDAGRNNESSTDQVYQNVAASDSVNLESEYSHLAGQSAGRSQSEPATYTDLASLQSGTEYVNTDVHVRRGRQDSEGYLTPQQWTDSVRCPVIESGTDHDVYEMIG